MNNEFHQDYIEEVRQLLKDLEGSLLNLEKNPDNTEEMNNAYRYLHTLKGSAGMFGFRDVERLAHELESLYSDVRDGIRQQDTFILDLTLHAVDVLGDLIEGKDAGKQADKIIKEIENLREQPRQDTLADNTATANANSSDRIYVIILRPEKQIFKRGLNFQAIIDDIHELGNVGRIVHNEIVPFEQQLASKEITSWLEVFLASKATPDVVKDVFMFLKPSEYEVVEITTPDIFAGDIYQQVIALDKQQVDERVRLLQHLSPDCFAVTPEPVATPLKVTPDTAETDADATAGVEYGKISHQLKKNSHVSVATGKLDQLINEVSELVIFRSALNHLMGGDQRPEVIEAMEKLERLTLRLRDSAFNIRLVPLSVLNVKFERLIRSVSQALGKEVEFITEGLDTELDRSMINALEAPLMHIIRNAIDHGIEKPEERRKRNKPEKGLLKFYSYNSGDHVFIQLQDDGNGIDFDKIREKGIAKGLLNPHQQYSEKELTNLMMTPGFSTADKVTTVSGRGVGMDVVKKEIAAIRGDIEVSTEKGLGSIFTLRLPLTLTILDTLVVSVSDNKYLIPINEIEFCYKETHAKLFAKKSRQVDYGGLRIPFVSLREYFGIPEVPEDRTVIVVNKNDTKIAIVVDSIIGKLQTVYKPLNEMLYRVDCFSGTSILGDGTMALILNPLKLKS